MNITPVHNIILQEVSKNTFIYDANDIKYHDAEEKGKVFFCIKTRVRSELMEDLTGKICKFHTKNFRL